jgi:hypothetical protein
MSLFPRGCAAAVSIDLRYFCASLSSHISLSTYVRQLLGTSQRDELWADGGCVDRSRPVCRSAKDFRGAAQGAPSGIIDAEASDKPGPEGKLGNWLWQPGPWLLVECLTGHIAFLKLSDKDPGMSQASWFRDPVPIAV